MVRLHKSSCYGAPSMSVWRRWNRKNCSDIKEKGFNVKMIGRKVEMRHALIEWIEIVNLNPFRFLLTLWKSILSLYPKSISIQYWIAYKTLHSLIR